MQDFTMPVTVRWSDLDPNFHMRHSVYYDLGAQMRINILGQLHLTPQEMGKHHFGPVLFREECVFRRELRFGDELIIDAKLAKARKDFSRWSIQHQIIRDGEELCAIITVDGAWLDTQKRKLTHPPEIAQKALMSFPKTEEFTWEEQSQAS